MLVYLFMIIFIMYKTKTTNYKATIVLLQVHCYKYIATSAAITNAIADIADILHIPVHITLQMLMLFPTLLLL